MGLLEKALTDLEAGRPKEGPGLFTKALNARSSREKPVAANTGKALPPAAEAEEPPLARAASPAEAEAAIAPARDARIESGIAPVAEIASEPEILPEPESPLLPEKESFPFGAAEIDELGAEIKALDPSEDGIFAAYSLVSEALPLEGLALLSVGEKASVLCASPSLVMPHVSRLNMELAGLAEAGGGSPLPEVLRQALPLAGGQERSGLVRASLSGKRGGGLLGLWLYSDKRIDEDPELVAAIDRLLSLAPPPVAEPADYDAISPALAALRLPIGSGRATALRYDLEAFLGRCEKLLEGLRKEILSGLLIHGVQSMLASEGKVFFLDRQKLVVVLFSKEVPDSELALFQFGKSLRRAFPFLSSATIPEGKALALDLAASGALEAFERFIAN